MDLTGVRWRKSSFSGGGNNGNCVEVGQLPGLVAVRDTKDRSRPAHVTSRAAWSALLRGVRNGEFDRLGSP